MAAKAKSAARPGSRRGPIFRAAKKAGREARQAASDVASSVEAQRAIQRARLAVKALGDAATAAGALVRAAWRTSGGHAKTFGHSRELRALQTSARGAAEKALATVRTTSAEAGKRGAAGWNRAVASGKQVVSRAERSVKQVGRNLRAKARKK